MADTTDVSQIPTAGGGVNKPASGTYGEGAALERLRAQFPTAPPQAAGSPAPAAPPMPTPPAAGISNQPSGLPPGLVMPTMQPDTPASTPLSAPAPNPMELAATERQKNLVVLQALVDDPRTSSVTKEWAEEAIRQLIQGSRR